MFNLEKKYGHIPFGLMPNMMQYKINMFGFQMVNQ